MIPHGEIYKMVQHEDEKLSEVPPESHGEIKRGEEAFFLFLNYPISLIHWKHNEHLHQSLINR